MLCLTLYGEFRATDSEGTEIRLTSKRAQALLAILTVANGQPQSRDALMALLWSERAEPQARASLRQVLSILRRELGAEKDALIITAGTLALDINKIEIISGCDADEFLAGFNLRDPAWEDWLRDERLRQEQNAANSQVSKPTQSVNPIVAVLPFRNLSGDLNQEYFSDGVTEDVIVELSKFTQIDVIARNSSFKLRGPEEDPRHVRDMLGARYIVQGTIRRAGDDIRVTARLEDADSGGQLWTERYDRKLVDIFSIQDEIAQMIVGATAGRIEAIDVDRARRKPTSNMDAYDLYLRTLHHFAYWTKSDFPNALPLIKRATSLDPNFAPARALFSNVLHCEWMLGRKDDDALDRATEEADAALAISKTNIWAMNTLSNVLIARGRAQEALAVCQRALRVNPNASHANGFTSLALGALGRHDDAFTHLERAMRLDPFFPNWMIDVHAFTLYNLRRYSDSIASAKRMTDPQNYTNLYLAAAYAQLGENTLAESEARMWRERVESETGMSADIEDTFSRAFCGFIQKEDEQHWREGLRRAGLDI